MLKLGKKHYYSTAEAADYLGVGMETIRRRIADGSLKAIRIQNRFFVDAETLESSGNKEMPKAEAVRTVGLFQRTLEHSASVVARENGEHVFYNSDGVPLMVARFATVSESVQSLGDGE